MVSPVASVSRGVTVKAARAWPAGLRTTSQPLTAAVGTVVWITDGLATLKLAATPPNVTFVTPVNPEPVMVTAQPGAPGLGETEVIFGSVALMASLSPA